MEILEDETKDLPNTYCFFITSLQSVFIEVEFESYKTILINIDFCCYYRHI